MRTIRQLKDLFGPGIIAKQFHESRDLAQWRHAYGLWFAEMADGMGDDKQVREIRRARVVSMPVLCVMGRGNDGIGEIPAAQKMRTEFRT